jgi:hypothetical protein
MQMFAANKTCRIAHCLLLTAHCLLLTAHYLLTTAYCSLLTAHCLLLTAYCLLLTAHCLLLTAYCLLLTRLLLTTYILTKVIAYCLQSLFEKCVLFWEATQKCDTNKSTNTTGCFGCTHLNYAMHVQHDSGLHTTSQYDSNACPTRLRTAHYHSQYNMLCWVQTFVLRNA